MKLEEHRDFVIKTLTELKSDTGHIKENMEKNEKWLNKINGRLRKTEEKISFLQGFGSFISITFGGIMAYLFRRGG